MGIASPRLAKPHIAEESRCALHLVAENIIAHLRGFVKGVGGYPLPTPFSPMQKTPSGAECSPLSDALEHKIAF